MRAICVAIIVLSVNGVKRAIGAIFRAANGSIRQNIFVMRFHRQDLAAFAI